MAKSPNQPVEPEIVTDRGGDAQANPELAEALKERDANYDRFLRAQAELETMRRRWSRELDEQRKYEGFTLVRDLLPAFDNLRRAVDAAQTGSSVESLKAGVEMVLKQVDEVFTQHSAKPIPAQGLPFDPNVHQAISQIPTDDHPPMSVVIEAERGYQMHDRIVRPSKVAVAVLPAALEENS